jgi:heparin binding hemagglutinin HbhA
MALIADLRKTVTDSTPVYAAVGLTDLAVEKVRDARVRASGVRVEVDPAALQAKAQAAVAEVAEQAQELPVLALNRSLVFASRAAESYESFALRGEKLVKRVRTQKATKDLISQAEATFALGKGAVTTVRRSATDIQRSAKATLTTGRKEAAVATDTVADEAATTVKESAARTRTAAKRTTTTTKKSAASTKRATKSVATSAKKTAAAASDAVEAAAEKVGD